MSVAYEELQGSWKRSVTATKDEVTRLIKIAFEDQDALVEQLFGNSISAGANILRQNMAILSGGVITEPYLVIQSCEFEPMPGDAPLLDDDGNLTYPNGLVATLKYSSVDFDLQGGQKDNGSTGQAMVSLNMDIGGEMINLPASMLKWEKVGLGGVSTSVPDQVNAGMIVPTTKLTLTLHQWPTLPLNAIRSLRGTVNSTTFQGAFPGTARSSHLIPRRSRGGCVRGHWWRGTRGSVCLADCL